MDAPEEEEVFWPPNTNTFGIPDDDKLKLAYSVYKPSKETLRLKSEKGRTVFAEAFIENPRLGTLADLCIRALVAAYGNVDSPFLKGDVSKERIFLNSISANAPIEEILDIDDEDFWKRVVLSKPGYKHLVLRGKDFDWKGAGLAVKYLELVEDCPAEYWPEDKMTALALKIRDHVTEMHIRKLQSLQDRAFERHFIRDSDTDKSDTTDVSDTTEDEGDEEDSVVEESSSKGRSEEEVEEEDEEAKNRLKEGMREMIASDDELFLSEDADDEMSEDSEPRKPPEIEGIESEKERKAKETIKRRADRRARRQAQIERRENREAKRQARELRRNAPPPSKKQKKIKSIFDIPIPEESDEEKLVTYGGSQHLKKLKEYNYPPEHCHHVDLRFLRLFTNLVDFSIKFQPPELGLHYHERHFKFSYDDIEHLAEGIRDLSSLRTFRLYNSLMDARKLSTIARALKTMQLNTIDFSNDDLKDDCGPALMDLFSSSNTIKHLELKSNFLSTVSMRYLGVALAKYSGELEYLGLSNNIPLHDTALHELCKSISPTKQISELDLSGIKLGDKGLICCIADELIRKHSVLKRLNLVAVSMSYRAGEELIKALQTNMKIIEMDCRACDLDFQQEFEIEVCVRRNRYIVENPYIGDTSKTVEEIEEFVNRVKNPILLRAREAADKVKECIENRPDIAERFSSHDLSEIEESGGSTQSLHTQRTTRTYSHSFNGPLSQAGSLEFPVPTGPFVYEPNSFTKEEFFEHMELPGPKQRYSFFKNARKRISRSDL